MGDGVSLKIKNRARLAAKLKKLVPAATAALVEANRQSAEEMVAYARELVPVSTGALRESILATPPGSTPPAYSQGVKAVPEGAYMVTAGNNGHMVEFGTRPHVNGGDRAGTENPGAKAQPFFYPAYRLVKKKHKARASKAIVAAAQKAIK